MDKKSVKMRAIAPNYPLESHEAPRGSIEAYTLTNKSTERKAQQPEGEVPMDSSQASCLLRHGLYQFGKSVLKSGRETPYSVRLPKSPAKDLFRVLGESAWGLDQLMPLQAVHCIGIANSGITLAEAIYGHGLEMSKDAELSIVYPRKEEQNLGRVSNDATTSVLIDNAVTTGETATKVLRMISPFGHQPKVIVRIFDREDVDEDGLSIAECIKTVNGLDVISIFRLRDVIPHLNHLERQAVLTYQSTYGTTSFKEWMGGQHVF